MAKLAFATLFLVAIAGVAVARPRFLAVPLEELEFVNAITPDGEQVIVPEFKHRLVRRAVPAPVQVPTPVEPETSADTSYGKPSYAGHDSYKGHDGYKGNDYVDYGAYTGGYGAFGWYTDHPVGSAGYGKH